jgi:hypothetical protein
MSMATGKTQVSMDALRKTVSLGREPHFGDAPSNAQLMEMVLALSAEVCVLRDRLDTHEQLADAGKPLTTDEVEAFEVTPERLDVRSGFRQRLLAKVFRPIRQAAARDLLSRHAKNATNQAAE